MSPFQRRAALLAGTLVATFSGCAGTVREPEVIRGNPPAPQPEVEPVHVEPAPEPVVEPVPVPAPTARTVKRPDGTCIVLTSTACPPGIACNPPPPKPVPCPPGL